MGWVACNGRLWRDGTIGHWFICCHDHPRVHQESDGPAVRDLARFGWSVIDPSRENPYCSHSKKHRFVEVSPGSYRTEHWQDD